ncbi:hypothetical protein [Streptomyces sp. Z26]|uniref:hypothetical protein n=1 Tax=Streptomyces sp. Z26 TaxID=2500177 RepID=UPI0019D01A43|nr:hypothetical protein [Streptomyces sp. Z26]
MPVPALAPVPLALAAVAAVLLVLAVAAVGRRLSVAITARREARRSRDRTPAAVRVAALAAAACTAYSGDTSWRFATHRLDMASPVERAAMFAAAELALFACALMARQNLKTAGAPGTPGLLVWAITGVQVIPAYSESGVVGGTVRAVVGPVLAAVLWHLAMGIELRHAKPDADSQGLLAIVAREARERLLARLGLARRGRDAAQISRDRATFRAVALAARLADLKAGGRRHTRTSRRLAVAVDRAQIGADAEQRERLMLLLAARRNANTLATMNLVAPWQIEGATVAPATKAPLAGAPVAPRTATLPALQGATAPALERHGATPQSATGPAPERHKESGRGATGDATGPATERPATVDGGATKAPRKATGKASKSATKSGRTAAKETIRELYHALGRRPYEGEMVDALKAARHPHDSRQFANKLRRELEAEHPELAALGSDNVRPMTGT